MSTHQKIYRVALPVPLRTCFDYTGFQDAPSIAIGSRVLVPFGKKEKVGVVLELTDTTSISEKNLKSIIKVLEPFPLFPPSLCAFIQKIAKYYHHPVGEVAFTSTPQALRKGESSALSLESPTVHLPDAPKKKMNEMQARAYHSVCAKASQFAPFLLEGITGSGKTEVYLQLTEYFLQQNQQVLILVPEIALTPQTLSRFQKRFSKVLCYHSKMTPSARWQAWLSIRHCQTHILIGTRSSVFLPFPSLGLIIVDEEHDLTFKQQDGFRYSARDAALLRAQLARCPVVLGSATPAFETLFNVEQKKYQGLYLPKRANEAPLPKMTIIDVRHKKLKGGLSSMLLEHIQAHLNNQGQILLFINRRGYAPVFMCYACGWIAQCCHCDARFTYHHQAQLLICHHCFTQISLPPACPTCQAQNLHPVGQGTERLEDHLRTLFPEIPLARLDSDATRKKENLTKILESAKQNQTRILIGTQMLTKGHHFPHLSMVAIVDADGGLFSTDFRAIERMAQLIIQVAGRAGRAHVAGEVFIQTLHPEHALLQQILRQDYHALASLLLKERKICQLPPYTHWALIRAQAKRGELALAFLKKVRAQLQPLSTKVTMEGPISATMQKRQGYFRYQLLLHANSRKDLHHLLSHSTIILENTKHSKQVRWSLDVDPLEIG